MRRPLLALALVALPLAPARAEPLCEDFVTECVLRGYVDPAVCASFASLPPGLPGVEVVDGDLYVDGARQWDCPPYGSEG
jgi:hypothetical protein